MKRGELFGGFIKAADLEAEGELTLTISGLDMAKFDDGQEQRVLLFAEDPRKFGLNATNWDACHAITGEADDDDWVGHKVTLYPTQTRFGSKMVPCVRIKAPAASVEKRAERATVQKANTIGKVIGQAGADRVATWCKDQGVEVAALAENVRGFSLDPDDVANWPADAGQAIKNAMAALEIPF